MRLTRFMILACLCAATYAAAAPAENAPKPRFFTRTNLFGWSAYNADPAVDAILMLTDDQKAKMEAAQKELFNSQAMQDLQKKAFDKNASDADRKTAREQLGQEHAKARAELKTRREAILTDAQKATIQKVDDTMKAAEMELRKEFEAKLRQALAAKLDTLLTPEQKDALTKAKAP